MNTREMIREFSRAFGRPVNNHPVELSVSDRELLGKLIFEECVEYLTKGLGLAIHCKNLVARDTSDFDLKLNEGQRYDPIESADGLGDMNVLVHFNALWHGFDLDAVTAEIHRSNMSKLGEDGKPIINECKYYGGDKRPYAEFRILEGDSEPVHYQLCRNRERFNKCNDPTHLIDPTRPAGKILKGPNYVKPDIASVVFF